MDRLLRWALAIFATYRLAKLLAEEDGPLFALARLRAYSDLQRQAEQARGLDDGPWASLDDGLRCAWCTGVWAALPCALLALYPRRLGDLLLAWLGVAGAQLFLERRGGD